MANKSAPDAPPQKPKKILQLRPNRFGLETPEAATSFFGALSSIPRAPFFERLRGRHHSITLEIVTINQSIYFFADLPVFYKTFFESQLISHYPTIQIFEVEDYLPQFIAHPHLTCGQIRFTSPFYFPLKSIKDFGEVDPLGITLGVMSKLQQGEGALIQMTLTAAPPNWQFTGRPVIARGIPGPQKGTYQAHPQAALIQTKIDSNGLHTSIKVAAYASDLHSSRTLLYNIGGAFGAFNTGEGNGLRLSLPNTFQKQKFKESILHRTIAYSPRNQIFSDEELATIWHIPGEKLAGIRNIAWGKRQKGEPHQISPTPANSPMSKKRTSSGLAALNSKIKKRFLELKTKTASSTCM